MDRNKILSVDDAGTIQCNKCQIYIIQVDNFANNPGDTPSAYASAYVMASVLLLPVSPLVCGAMFEGQASNETDTPRVVSFQPCITPAVAPGRPPATIRKSLLGSWIVGTQQLSSCGSTLVT